MAGLTIIKQRDNRLWYLTNAALRQAVLRGATRPVADNVIVNEFPKSGGSWLSQMLAETLDLPFPRNRLPMVKSCIMQCHILNPWGMRNVVVVWRDGRDIMVSLYHHIVVGHDRAGDSKVKAVRARLGITDPADVQGNLPRFIEATMTDPVVPRFTWPQFVETWSGRPGVIETRYEALLIDPAAELARIATGLGRAEPDRSSLDAIVERYSFRAQSGRTAGQENKKSFLRKGIAGDWKNYFGTEATEIFNHHAGSALRKLGYLEM